MSKVAKAVIIFLFVLLIAASGLAMFTVISKEKIGKEKAALEKEIKGLEGREKKYLVDNKNLKSQMKNLENAKTELETAKVQLEEQLSGVDVGIIDLDKKVKKLAAERNEFKMRVDTIKQERDGLLVKLQEKPGKEIVYKYIEREPEKKEEVEKVPPAYEEESYWAQVLKTKASLEVELEELKMSLSKSALEVGEWKKTNSDLQLEFSQLENEKELIERKIKHGRDLSDTLSLELTRAQNDKQFLNDHVKKMTGENTYLHEQVKQLTSTKIALEKSIVRLQEERKDMEKRLFETENVIQSRMDEIRGIKERLEGTFKLTSAVNSREIELPPIIVSAQSPTIDLAPDVFGEAPVGFGGNIVSVNEENNFVIVDVGERSGVRPGDTLNVYRGAEYIAALEIIQVRKDIAAADIKNKIVKIQVGDAVR